MLELFMLGTGGTCPSVNRALASAVVRVNGKGILIDCGEATQIQLQKVTVAFNSIDYICITHLHADHVSGLLGFLLAIKTAERVKPITIIGPAKIQQFVKNMFLITSVFPFPLKFIELSSTKQDCAIIDGGIKISSVMAQHSVPCFSYSVELLRGERFLVEKAEAAGLPIFMRSLVFSGKDIKYNNVIYRAKDFVSEARKGLKLSYVTDTRPTKSLYSFIHNSDIAIVEGMYRDFENILNAKQKGHMIWDESVSLAKNNNIGELILTHYSPSVQLCPSDTALLKSKCSIATLGVDGLYRDLVFDDACSCEESENSVVAKKRRSRKSANGTEPEQLDNTLLIAGLCKKYNLLPRVNNIVRLNAFMYDLVLDDVSHLVYVYKSKQSMKEPYSWKDTIRDYNVYFVDNLTD